MDPRRRERIVNAIRELEKAATEAHRADPSFDTEKLTPEVLERLGVDPEDYARALAEDPDLALLESAALREAMGDPPDPGPYGCISREAPTGKPGDMSATARQNVVQRR